MQIEAGQAHVVGILGPIEHCEDTLNSANLICAQASTLSGLEQLSQTPMPNAHVPRIKFSLWESSGGAEPIRLPASLDLRSRRPDLNRRFGEAFPTCFDVRVSPVARGMIEGVRGDDVSRIAAAQTDFWPSRQVVRVAKCGVASDRRCFVQTYLR